ncbi:hypothetical protein NCCP1664_28550 [Zafaria cholistanensis]|uniref:LysM domain-containing protein n=1 Tax=Zafaria cholistanensis TaxID=1682741 RepID=A0A5A7NU47_9MICC|nr:lytic transglycosylase domain-containing protein [Zafaria cholistanensis]GER24360.1 hypothetical protein NCCP1664_28550 [Zafaria cholistanensis]
MTDSATPRVRQMARARQGAVAAAAIPAVVLTSLASTAPALAAGPAMSSVLAPKAATGARIAAAQDRIAAHLVAARVPSRVTVAAAAATSVVVKSGDTLSGIAKKHGVGVASLVKLNGLASADRIHVGQRLTLRAGSSARTAAAAAAPAGTYTVVRGDTLSGIAARRGMALGSLLQANGLKATSTIYPGQKLKVSGASAAGRTSGGKAPAAAAAAPAGTYTVVRGDTLSGIAARRGMALGSLLQANGLKATSTIYPGQKLKVSGASANTASSQLVPSTFLHYTYPAATVSSANRNKAILLSRNLPSRAEMKSIIAATARKMGVNPALALAHAYQESGFSMSAVSPANAIGAMQVIPSSGEWASQLVGRRLDLLNPYDNATAGVAIIRALQRTSATEQIGIASYYQGQASVRKYGMFSDTKRYVANVLAHKKAFS